MRFSNVLILVSFSVVCFVVAGCADGGNQTYADTGDDVIDIGHESHEMHGELVYRWYHGQDSALGSMYVQWTSGSTESETHGWVEDSVSEPSNDSVEFSLYANVGSFVRVSAFAEIEGGETVFNCEGDGSDAHFVGVQVATFYIEGSSDLALVRTSIYNKSAEGYSGGCESMLEIRTVVE